MVQGAELNFCFRRSAEKTQEDEAAGDAGDAAPVPKKKKKKQKAKAVEGGADDGGQGVVVSLLEQPVVVDCLPQIEEMVG